MGNGLIILGLFGIASVIAGNQESVYTGVKGIVSDSRTLPTIVLIVMLLWVGSLSDSKSWKAFTRALSVLIGIAVVFSIQKNPYTFLPSFFNSGTKQNG
jgi:hypothetical protein